MFNKHEDATSSELAVLPDELLDEVAGGKTFYEYTSPDGGETVCLPFPESRNHSHLVPVMVDGQQKTCIKEEG